MDSATEREVEDYRGLPSAEAADLIVQQHPRFSSVTAAIIAGRSWARSDQRRLADHYFQAQPFASALPYQVFSEKLSIKDLIDIATKHMPSERNGRSLAIYHLKPVLFSMAKSEHDQSLTRDFLIAFDN